MSKIKEIYYSDELNDDFSGIKVEAVKIDGKYDYAPQNFLWKFISWFLYRVVALPIAYIYLKLKFGYKIENKEVLKGCKDKGYYMYINHTQNIADVLWPTFANFPKKAYILANPDNVSLPILKYITKMLGAIPIPSDIESGRHFVKTIEQRIAENGVIAIYPEAHIWKYYTKIRPFKDSSFKYPAQKNIPVFSLTITYQKWGNRKRPRIVAYVDGPFFADGNLSIAKRREQLRNDVYNTMVGRSKNSNVEFIKYYKVCDNND